MTSTNGFSYLKEISVKPVASLASFAIRHPVITFVALGAIAGLVAALCVYGAPLGLAAGLSVVTATLSTPLYGALFGVGCLLTHLAIGHFLVKHERKEVEECPAFGENDGQKPQSEYDGDSLDVLTQNDPVTQQPFTSAEWTSRMNELKRQILLQQPNKVVHDV